MSKLFIMKRKKCTIYKGKRLIKFFNSKAKSKDGLQPQCQPCGQDKSRFYYSHNKQRHKSQVKARKGRIVREYLNRIYLYLLEHPCIDCGEADPVVLEFDHVRGRKEAEVSFIVRQGVSWERINSEMDKCEVRCANCHKRKTAKTLGFYKWCEYAPEALR